MIMGHDHGHKVRWRWEGLIKSSPELSFQFVDDGTESPQATGHDEMFPRDCGRDPDEGTGKLCFPDGLLCQNSKSDDMMTCELDESLRLGPSGGLWAKNQLLDLNSSLFWSSNHTINYI